METSRLFPFFAFLLLSQTACGPDVVQEKINQTALTGHWVLLEAFRNGKQTESLTGTFYVFTDEGKLRTNFTGTEVEHPFSISGDEIKQESDPEVVYKVEEMSDSVLVVSFVYSNFPFKLKLQKGSPELTPETQMETGI